jgi:hypothetical protein
MILIISQYSTPQLACSQAEQATPQYVTIEIKYHLIKNL